MTGLEPAAFGMTGQYINRLSYILILHNIRNSLAGLV